MREANDPLAFFARWYGDATRHGAAGRVHYPTAVALATATADGVPSLRMVLLKSYDAAGFVFYTNRQSRKGQEIDANAKASLCFRWSDVDRRVQIEGMLTPVAEAEADAYFNSRPFFSRLGAWASRQSEVKPVPQALWIRLGWQLVWRGWRLRRPPHWTGFCLQALRLRFDEVGVQTHFVRADTAGDWHGSQFQAVWNG